MGLFSIIPVATGAFIFWSFSGFNGSFDDYMSGRRDADWKYWKNYLTGTAVIFVVVMFVYAVMERAAS